MTNVAREIRICLRAGLRQDRPTRAGLLLGRCPLLSELPQVDQAGSDPTVRYQYLVQALADAVARMAPERETPDDAGGGAREHSHRNQQDFEAVQRLFGFTPQTRWADWRSRQDQAAEVYRLSWDRFRHSVQEDLILCVSRELVEISKELLPRNLGSHLGSLETRIKVEGYRQQADIEAGLIAYIRAARPQTALFLEHSSATVKPILHALREVNCHIQLLLGHPSRTPSSWQRRRTEIAINELRRIQFRGYSNVEVRFYHTPAGLRGRRIGDYVVLGWYTYRDDLRREASDPADVEVWGHDNALVVGDSRTPGGGALSSWFEREFEHIWNHRQTHTDDDLFPEI